MPFNVHFESDQATTAYGFAIDKVEYFTGIPAQPPAPFANATSSHGVTYYYKSSCTNGLGESPLSDFTSAMP